MITLTRAEQNAVGFDQWTESPQTLGELAYNCWIVIDDAPYPYWERQKLMDVLENLAKRIGHPFI